MTYYFSYIGDLDDPKFHWDPDERTYQIGNLPARILPKRPDSLGVSIFGVMERIKTGQNEGRQLDWGSWGLKLTGDELRAFFANRPEILPLLTELEAERLYLLVAAEQ